MARYKVGGRLGDGGMATVHHGEVTSPEGFRRTVALKFIHERLSQQPEFEAQFRSEATVLAHLRHPNIVQVLDFDRDDAGRLFIAMELVEGTDLRRVRDYGPLPVPIAVHVVAEVLRGLSCAHEATDEEGRVLGLVHRDLSPQNVLVSWRGDIKITDFGIAHSLGGSTTRTGVVKGNAGYMSPEQIEGLTLDGRSDLFTVGVLFHELLLGAPLFARRGLPTRSILSQILLGRAKPPASLRDDIPQSLSDFVMCLLATESGARPASATVALRQLLELQLVSATGALDFAHYLQAVRRTTEKRTVLDDEAPKGLEMPAPAALSAPLDHHTETAIVPIDGAAARRQFPVLPLFTACLAVLVGVLVVLLTQQPQPEPQSPQSVASRSAARERERSEAATREAAQVAATSDAGCLDAALGAPDASSRTTPRTVRPRGARRFGIGTASAPGSKPAVDAGLLRGALLPYSNDALLPYSGEASY